MGFQLGTGLRKPRVPWGKHARIHLGLLGESKGLLTLKAGGAAGFLLPTQAFCEGPREELHFPPTPTPRSHGPGLLRAQGTPRSPATLGAAPAGTSGTIPALPSRLPHRPHAPLVDTALPSHVSRRRGPRSPHAGFC